MKRLFTSVSFTAHSRATKLGQVHRNSGPRATLHPSSSTISATTTETTTSTALLVNSDPRAIRIGPIRISQREKLGFLAHAAQAVPADRHQVLSAGTCCRRKGLAHQQRPVERTAQRLDA